MRAKIFFLQRTQVERWKYSIGGTVIGPPRANGRLMLPVASACVWQIVLHLSNFVEPRLQSQIVRIVFMVPTYSVTAFLSLRFVHW